MLVTQRDFVSRCTMSNKEAKDLSLLIYSTLNNFGFKKENVRFRANCLNPDKVKNKCFHELSKKLGVPIRVISVGSSGEGLQLSNSDLDLMVVPEDVICLDRGNAVENLTILETDHSKTAPGYTKVVLKNTLDTCRSMSGILLNQCTYDSATSAGRHSYVSSTKFKNFFLQSCLRFNNDGVHYEKLSNGPAQTYMMSSSNGVDQVLSLLFYDSEQLPKWTNRTRYYSWPSKKCLREISGKEGYLVPVGDKQSANQDLEWRICYTTAEKDLIASLNDVQIKIYVLLKMVTNSVLKKVCKALTSYVVKNVVFWIMEGTPNQSLSPELIVNLIQKSLYFIKCCLENNHFPNYMIPERNLLRDAINGREKQNVINFLSDCLQEGGTVLLRVPKLYQCVSYSRSYPENVIRYGKWRDEVEKQIFLLSLRIKEICDFYSLLTRSSLSNDLKKSWLNDARVVDILKKIVFLVLPDLMSLLLSGKDYKEEYAKRLEMIGLL